MSDKRDIIRRKKRTKVRFGVDFPKRVAFTEDISEHGLFIMTGQPEHPGTLLELELTLPDGQQVIATGRVHWAKKVPANLVRVAKKGGMGVRLVKFKKGEKLYRSFVAGLRH